MQRKRKKANKSRKISLKMRGILPPPHQKKTDKKFVTPAIRFILMRQLQLLRLTNYTINKYNYKESRKSFYNQAELTRL